MIIGIGNDIIAIQRIKDAILRQGNKFLDRLFTENEKKYCLKFKEPEKNFAGRFAAKEAFAKALGSGFGKEISWLDIEILNDEKGKPYISLASQIKEQMKGVSIFLSISHCNEYATAIVVFEHHTQATIE